MKAKLILINWVLSFMGCCIVHPFWATLVGVMWFIGSCALLAWAQNKTWFKNEILKSKFFNNLINDHE